MVLSSVTLITGANGFIGRALCQRMREAGKRIRGAVRTLKNASGLPQGIDIVQIGGISGETDWRAALSGVDTVVHLAGMAHTARNKGLPDFRAVNVEGAKSLALASAKAGVRRFIFISSVGVNGEAGSAKPFCDTDRADPRTAYAMSKYEAEQALLKISKETGMQTVILRPPLVYGPDAPGNFARLMRLIKTGMPLPFGGIKNLRSFIYLGNLVDAINLCADHPLAAGQIFLVSDGRDISTTDLIRAITSAMNKKAALFPLHPGMLKVLCKISGKSDELEKFTGSLVVDSSKIRNLLGWKAPFTFEEGIKETIKH